MTDITIESRHLKHIKAGRLTAKHSADGTRILRYYLDLQNTALKLHRELSSPEIFLLQHKVHSLVAHWDEMIDKQQKRSKVDSGKWAAEDQTVEALGALDALTTILQRALSTNDRIDWNALKDHTKYTPESEFTEPRPARRKFTEPTLFHPQITFWDKLFGRASKKVLAAQEVYASEMGRWRIDEAESVAKFAADSANWERRRDEHAAEIALHEAAFLRDQSTENGKVDVLSANVALGDSEAVIEHASMVLEASDYDGLFEKDYALEYLAADKTLLIEYELPSPDIMPTVKAVRFVALTGEMKETHISERDQKSNYDSVCYQICLRTLHELFEADEFTNLEKILFNGKTTFVDRATGKEVASTIMSIMVDRDTFQNIDLARVDPKLCFKNLKGVSGASLAALAPIAPVMTFDKEDRRFIDPRSVAPDLNSATNLASMPWEDFEHLVREVFEKEFARRGGEVKITQSSSDGGVDAVAFDPDPITGGKIVVQAKRYTRTVGVSAVRDLYGTMQHERASRGILVTTADFGPDAYQFSAEKHITLMTGANLLHLLDRHGIAAKIDVRQARKELNLRDLGRR